MRIFLLSLITPAFLIYFIFGPIQQNMKKQYKTCLLIMFSFLYITGFLSMMVILTALYFTSLSNNKLLKLKTKLKRNVVNRF